MKVDAIHLYYHGKQDILLINRIYPFLFKAQQGGLMSKFFITRYWNGGDHLRIRFFDCANSEAILNSLENLLEAHVIDHPHQAQYESEYKIHCEQIKSFHKRMGLKGMERIVPLHQVPAVKFQNYVFESQRYGVGRARLISEDHFAFSTEFAYCLMKISEGSMSQYLTLLLHVSLMTTAVLPLELHEVGELFHELSQSSERIKNSSAKKNQNYLASFSDQLPALKNLITQLETWVQETQDMCVLSGNQLMSVPGQNKKVEYLLQEWQKDLILRIDALQQITPSETLSIDISSIVMSYLHMLFNRLGIPNSTECYMYYLLKGTIDQVITRNQCYARN